jgi:hypothetical protein
MPSGTAARLPGGRWWDAVTLSAFVADDTLAVLRDRDRLAGTIRDGIRGCVTWLIPPGAARAWRPLPWVQILGTGTTLHVPPADWHPTPWTHGPAMHWLAQPHGSALAHPDEVHRALQETLLPASRAVPEDAHRG